MPEKSVVGRSSPGPHGAVTAARLVSDLRRLGVEPGMDLLVHSSLSRLGWVVGGAQSVVEALEEAIGPSGTLLMPAFSLAAPEPSRWENPPVPRAWWSTIREAWPPFRPDLTPTRGLGVVPETFRHQTGTLRSLHPTLSFCARGPKARRLLAGHSLDFGTGEKSPLARLYALGGHVLLLGVDHGSNSSLHLAEYRSRWKGRERTLWFEGGVARNGRVERVRFRDLDGTSEDFARLGHDLERTRGSVRVGKVGAGTGRLMAQRVAVDFGVEWLPKHRGVLGPEESTPGKRSGSRGHSS